MTPIRQQYLKIKKQHQGTILFFRLGDFYETFDDDAHVASKELDIVLTFRSMGKGLKVPMAGIPIHVLEPYLAKLIRKGHKVAICEQLSKSSKSDGLVSRDVVRIVTPGTVMESSLLEEGKNNYLVAVNIENQEAGIAYVDITTGEFSTTQMHHSQVDEELNRLNPAELLIPQGQNVSASIKSPTDVPPWTFDCKIAKDLLIGHFKSVTLEPYGCENLKLATGSAGAILEYLKRTNPDVIRHIESLNTYSDSTFMKLDRQTTRNLELFHGGRWGEDLSLLSVIDFTKTPMGTRLLRKWIGQPLIDLQPLIERQSAVDFFYNNFLCREKMRVALAKINDLERIMYRVKLFKASTRDFEYLKVGIAMSSKIASIFKDSSSEPVRWLKSGLQSLNELEALINNAIEAGSTNGGSSGQIIRRGFSQELDDIRSNVSHAREFIASLELKEREKTGIKSLKVGYNKIFGYYIEVNNSNLDRVPDSYLRRQTLVNGERFITPELKEYESLILNAEEQIEELEDSIFRQICSEVSSKSSEIGELGHAIAKIDVCCSLSEAASKHNYCKPTIMESGPIDIKGGRHPIVEQVLLSGTFVPNNIALSSDQAQLIILTGPNMSGKSTYIRQIALITLMAQIGSFVPAESATIGLVDRIFTRVGLQDDLVSGQSTFMVEMLETAAIINQATPKSLVILDEIGRGTSTYDGLSIAKAVIEHIHNDPGLGCKTLFATHYHELTNLQDSLPRVKNYNVAVSEKDDHVVFLHRIIPGAADKSYGVHVAELAGFPKTVISRAWEILKGLETISKLNLTYQSNPPESVRGPLEDDLTNITLKDLANLNISEMTPLEAITKLYDLQKNAGDLDLKI